MTFSKVETIVDAKLYDAITDLVGAPDMDVVDEDWLAGVSCNPDEPEMCESCQ